MYPFIQIGSSIFLPSFFLVVSIAVSLSLVVYSKILIKKELDYSFHIHLALVLMLSGFVGGRLTHVLIEQPRYYLMSPEKIFYLWEGGYVFFGGLIGATLAGLYYYHRQFKSWKMIEPTLDSLAAPTALAYSLGRIGCLLSGCCYGQLTNVSWAVDHRHPTQIYATLWEFGVFCILMGLAQRTPKLQDGKIFWTWLGLHGVGRFWIELLRDDFRGPNFIFSVSGWVSLVLVMMSLYFLCQKVSQSNPVKTNT